MLVRIQKSLLFILLVLVVFIFDLYSQPKSIKFEKFGTEKGLSQNQVFCIYQDSKGFLWFGTQDGLNLYDGYTFRVFRHQPGNENSLLDYAVNAICESDEGIFWIGTREGLSKLNLRTGIFTHYTHNPDSSNSLVDNNVWCIIKDSENNLWIGTRNGLSHFNPTKNRFTNYSSSTGENTISHNFVLSITEDSNKNIWICDRGGLDKYNLKSGKFYNYKIHPEKPNSVALNGLMCSTIMNGVLWLGSYSGLYSVNLSNISDDKIVFQEHLNNSNNQTIAKQSSEHTVHSVRSIYAGSDNTIWAGTYGSGLIRYKPQTKETIFYKNTDQQGSISENYIIAVLEDKHNVLWAGTSSSGLNKHNLSSEKFSTLTFLDDDGSGNAHIGAVLEGRNGNLWVGTELGNIFKLNNPFEKNSKIQQFGTEKYLKTFFRSVEIRSFMEDKKGQIWAASFGNGIYVIDPQSNNVKRINQNDSQTSIANDFVHCIYQSSDGIIWIGTGAGGLNKYDPINNEFVFYQNDPKNEKSISTNEVTAIVEDNLNQIWAGTSVGGLNLLNRKTGEFEHFIHDVKNVNTISSNRIICLYNDQKGNLWIGTFGGGLNKWQPQSKTFKHFTTENGLPSNIVNSIVEDYTGNLWISTDKGISLFKVEEATFKNYDVNDGLQGNEFLHSAGFISKSSGFIYFGGVNGINFFKAEDFYKKSKQSNVVFTDFKLFNQSISFGNYSTFKSNILFADEIALSHDQNFFTFEFASLDFNNPDKNQYAYKMEGFNKDWINSGNQRFATYTNLDPGEYTFKVKATNSDGLWNEEGASIKVILLPPWWKTWWAYLLYTIIIGSLLVFARRFEMKRIKLKNELELKHIEANKLQEVDKLKSRFFANISHEFRTPLTLVLGLTNKLAGKTTDHLDKKDFRVIRKNANRLLQLINQLLELSKLEAGNVSLKVSKYEVNKFLRRILSSFTSLVEQRNLTLKLNGNNLETTIVNQGTYLYLDAEKFETVIYNLISNAIKFTPPGGKIDVDVIPHLHNVEISFTNTGIGIPKDKLEHIFDRFYQVDESTSKDFEGTGIGLALAKEIIELHNGEIKVTSIEGKETTFTIRIPVGRANFKPEQVIEKSLDQKGNEKFPDNILVSIENEEYAIEKSEIGRTKTQSKIILLVEDNLDLRNYISEQLESDFAIYEAEDGEKGLNLAIEILPDLIISDIMMPKMDGYQLCKKLRKDIRTSHIPIIMLTAKAGREDKLEGLETGADDYLLKPFDQEELKIRVNNLIKLREQMREKFLSEMMLRPREVIVPSSEKVFLEKLIEILEKKYTNDKFGVDELSSEVGLSRSQLHRKLKAVTDQTTTEFIRNFRLQRAADLIMQNAGNMAEIAYQVGFSSQAYFTKSFSEFYNCSPLEYRKKNLAQ